MRRVGIAVVLAATLTGLLASPGLADAFHVTGLLWTVDKPSYSGPCPAKLTFVGDISTDGAGTVQYQFIRSDGGIIQPKTTNFVAAGTKKVSTTWTLGGAKLPTYSGWLGMKVLAPNENPSANQALEDYTKNAGKFTVTCVPKANIKEPITKPPPPGTPPPVEKPAQKQ